VAIHDADLDVEPLFARALIEQVEHDGGLVSRQHLCTEARSGNAEGAAPSRYVKEPHAWTELSTAEALASQPHLRRSIGPVVAWRDPVPGGSCFCRRWGGIVLRWAHGYLAHRSLRVRRGNEPEFTRGRRFQSLPEVHVSLHQC